MTYQFRPDASAVNPASPPSCVALIPDGGLAGVSSPRIPSHQTDHGTIAMSIAIRISSRPPTSTQFVSSSVREIFRASTVIRNTSTSSPIASSRTYSSSSGRYTRPVISANSPWPAPAAQPPKMNAKYSTNSENGTHSFQPGGTLPKPTTGTSPVATTYREISTL